MGMDGGMIGPIVADSAVTAAANSGSKPSLIIASTSICPSPPASATADPLMPEKTIDATTLACPRPPGIEPTQAEQARKIFRVTPPVFISLAARMKKGIASSV